MKHNVSIDGSAVNAEEETNSFPAFAELGGCAIVSSALRDARHGLALFSGRTFSGKTTALAALANELQRAGRNVLAVRAPHVESIPNIEELTVDYFRPSLIQDLLIGDKQDVVIVDDIRSSDAANFVADLIAAGILVIASIHAADPWKALSHFLYRCGGNRNKVIAESLLFSYGLDIRVDPNDPDKMQDDVIANAVFETELLFSSANLRQVPSPYSSRYSLVSNILFPDEKVREFILSYRAIYTEQ
jgi:hypothetical protein